MGVGEFSVTAGKEGASSDQPRSDSKALSGIDGPWRHFVCVVPPSFGLKAPVRADTLEMQGFNSGFGMTVALDGFKLPDGLSFREGLSFSLGAEHVAHPEKILADQPFLGTLRATVRLLDQCLGRKIAQPEFLKELNAAGLPVSWRDELANGVFTQTDAPERSPGSGDDIDALLSAISLTGAAPAEPAAAERFISEVGASGTGFVLNALEAGRFREGMAELLRDLEKGFLDHPSVAGPMGLALALHSLLKRMRGPRHLHFHLLPAVLPPEEYRRHWEEALAEHPGSIEAWVYLASGQVEEDAQAAAWATRFGQGRGAVLVQARVDAAAGWVAWSKSAVPAYVFVGGVAAAMGEDRHFFKPSALAYLEALLENQARLPEAASETLALPDSDVDPATRSAADKVYDSEGFMALRGRGLNPPLGFKNRADLNFPPLVPASEAK